MPVTCSLQKGRMCLHKTELHIQLKFGPLLLCTTFKARTGSVSDLHRHQ